LDALRFGCAQKITKKFDVQGCGRKGSSLAFLDLDFFISPWHMHLPQVTNPYKELDNLTDTETESLSALLPHYSRQNKAWEYNWHNDWQEHCAQSPGMQCLGACLHVLSMIS
jgi:hypothetical protein